MPLCVCNKEFASDEGLKTHLRRLRCKGPPKDDPNRCEYCQRSFSTYAGLRQHIRRAHPAEYNSEFERQYEGGASAAPTADDQLDEDELLIKMAQAEASYDGRFINQHLKASVCPDFTIDQIKYRRRQVRYQEYVAQLQQAPQRQDILEEIYHHTEVEHGGLMLSSRSKSDRPSTWNNMCPYNPLSIIIDNFSGFSSVKIKPKLYHQ
ncbi:hypothetical protein ABEB36_000276 [Hypothenemus hampei]|uniref:C2H2-type domain-containing protein n=1 Tax=Hypothenemus hampei TaxID=57062 RepID=A0ABD1FAQ1_HYPHA